MADFQNDPPPRVKVIPWSHLVGHFTRNQKDQEEDVYLFGGRRKFPEPLVPGIYDPTTDVLE